jgi:hypothetical protein
MATQISMKLAALGIALAFNCTMLGSIAYVYKTQAARVHAGEAPAIEAPAGETRTLGLGLAAV